MPRQPSTSSDTTSTCAVWTLGHSRHPWDRFLALLRTHDVALVADIRSLPVSRFSPHFRRERMEAALRAAGTGYEWLGEGLGGRPQGEEFYDTEGRVQYDRIAATARFAAGIARLMALARVQRVAMLCSEEDPSKCHRRLLVAPALLAAGVGVLHIRGDGRVEPEVDGPRNPASTTRQGLLFPPE